MILFRWAHVRVESLTGPEIIDDPFGILCMLMSTMDAVERKVSIRL